MANLGAIAKIADDNDLIEFANVREVHQTYNVPVQAHAMDGNATAFADADAAIGFSTSG